MAGPFSTGTGAPTDDNRPQELVLYAAMITFAKQRLILASTALVQPHRRADLEFAALNVRLALEHIVFSTLTSSRPTVQAVSAAFQGKGASEVRALLRRLAPEYWPKPFSWSDRGDVTWTMTEPAEPYLAESDWGPAYGFCSELLHAPNPYSYLREQRAVETALEQRERLLGYTNRLRTLLQLHMTRLAEADTAIICCAYVDEPARKPTVEVFVRRETQ